MPLCAWRLIPMSFDLSLSSALLRQTDWPQDKVAQRSGFGSVDAMARTVRQHLGRGLAQLRGAR